MNKLFRAPTQNTLIQLLRYSLVGGSAFLIDFGLLWGLTKWCNLHYLSAAGLSFIVGLITNYTLSIRWVFTEHTLHNRVTEFTTFAIIGIAGLGLNEGVIWMATEWLQCHYIASKIFSATVVFFWNFLARKKLLFNEKDKK